MAKDMWIDKLLYFSLSEYSLFDLFLSEFILPSMVYSDLLSPTSMQHASVPMYLVLKIFNHPYNQYMPD